MGYMTGSEAAEYIYSQVIPKTVDCARQSKGAGTPRARLAAQIDCVRTAFGKTASR